MTDIRESLMDELSPEQLYDVVGQDVKGNAPDAVRDWLRANPETWRVTLVEILEVIRGSFEKANIDDAEDKVLSFVKATDLDSE